REWAVSLGDLSRGLDRDATSFREQGLAAAAASGHTMTFANGSKDAADAARKAAEAAKHHADEMKHQADAAKLAEQQLKALTAGMTAFFDELGQKRDAHDNLLGMLGPSAQDATTQMGELASSMEAWGGAAQLSDAQLSKLITDMQAQAR